MDGSVMAIGPSAPLPVTVSIVVQVSESSEGRTL
jgi:hypothetical protein